MALTTVTVHIDIRQPVTNVPAVGTVVFNTLIELRDVVANVTYSPMTFTATLVAGQATITLPATDNPDLLPASWVYQVWINTDILNDVQYMQIPFAAGTTEFADLTPVDFDPCDGAPLPVPIPPDSSNLFVKKSGDTMSGNLIINANLQVNGSASATYQGVSGDIVRLLSTTLSTGIVSGGVISPNVNPALLDIAAFTGWIVDYDSSGIPGPTNPVLTYVSVPAQIGLPVTVGFPNGVTWWLANSAGTIIQQTTVPTPTQRRTHLIIGATAQQAGVIVAAQTLPVVQAQPTNQFIDLMDALGNFNITGNRISSNGANLTIQKTSGTIFARGFNQTLNHSDPHTVQLSAQTPITFRHITAVPGGAGPLVTTLNVGSYDPNGTGVVTAIPGAGTVATNFRLWGFGTSVVNNQILIQYGQSVHPTLSQAILAIGTTGYIPSPTGAAVGVLLGWISVIKSATDLSNTSQANFTTVASKFATP